MNFATLYLSRHLSLKWRRIAAVLALSSAFGASAPVTSWANEPYPNKPVKVVVPFAAGGPADVLARLIANKLQANLQSPFIVENKTGSGGAIGTAAVAKADADGYTVLITPDSVLTINPSLYSSMSFRPEELKPVMLLGSSGMSIAVNPAVGVKSLKELVVKGKAESMTFGSAGNGSPGHIGSEMLSRGTGIQVNHIPYRGNAPSVAALLSGEIQAGVLATPGLVQHFKSGRLQPLAVTGKQRSVLLPDVPTTKELGYPDVDLELYYVVMVPVKTPDAVITTLQKALTQALAQPDVKERLHGLDFISMGMTGGRVEELLSNTKERYAKVIKVTGMKVE